MTMICISEVSGVQAGIENQIYACYLAIYQ